MEQARALPALVRGLVVGEAGVALDPEQRTADGLGLGAVVLADPGQDRLQVGEQALERTAYVLVVVGLVGLEPLAFVVARQTAQELEAGVGEIAAQTDRILREG